LTDNTEKRQHPRIPVRWPITIISKKGNIEGESRNITVAGLFVHCLEKLEKNEEYQMIIKIPEKESLLLNGRVVWSNFENIDLNASYIGMGFCFIKISKEDRSVLSEVISQYADLDSTPRDLNRSPAH
jgi:hypothetical protein